MSNQAVYLAKGIWHLTSSLAVIGAVFFAFNVLGYFLLTNDIGIRFFTTAPGLPKWLRIVFLAFDGVVNVFAFCAALALSVAAVVLVYKWLLYLGGYKPGRP